MILADPLAALLAALIAAGCVIAVAIIRGLLDETDGRANGGAPMLGDAYREDEATDDSETKGGNE